MRRTRSALLIFLVLPLVLASGFRLAEAQDRDTQLLEAAHLKQQAAELFNKAQFDGGIPLLERALAIVEKVLGSKHQGVAAVLVELGQMHEAKGDLSNAEPLYLRAVAIYEKKPGEKHINLAVALGTLAGLYGGKGESGLAEPLYLRAVAIFEKGRRTEDPEFANVLNNLALLYLNRADYARAEPLFQRALEIQKKSLGPEHRVAATTLGNLALLYLRKGDLTRAEPLYLSVLSIQEKATDENSPNVALALSNLAAFYQIKGDYSRVEPLLQRALTICERTLGKNHPLVATVLSSLAASYSQKGDYARAEPLAQRALAILEKAFGPDHPAVASTLNNLGVHRQVKHDYAGAEQLYERALAIFEKTLGPAHPTVADTLNFLGWLNFEKGNYARSEPLLQRALAIEEKVFGAEHPNVARTLHSLATLYLFKGDYERAEPLYQRALALLEKAGGVNHPDIALVLNSLATVSEATGRVSQALRLRIRAAENIEHTLALVIATGSENQKRLYLATFSDDSNANISLHLRSAPTSEEAAHLSLTTLMRRKGRVLDAMTDQTASLRRRLDPQDKFVLDHLGTVRSQLGAAVFNRTSETTDAQYVTHVNKLQAEVEQLEKQVGARSAEFRTQAKATSLEQVQQAIPEGAALVELVLYKPFNAKAGTPSDRFGEARYAVYVIRSGQGLAFVDLGNAAPIERAVGRFRTAGSNPVGSEIKLAARGLDELVMRPIRKLLGPTRRIFLSPDGELNLIPFAALVDENGRYLIEDYSVSYLTSGRDLLRLQIAGESRETPKVFANPLYDLLERQQPVSLRSTLPVQVGTTNQRSKDFAALTYRALPGTAAEASALGKIFPDATLLTQGQATEAALKQVNRPSILHIATHGFFLTDEPESTHSLTRGFRLDSGRGLDPAELATNESPLLRSGLVLAGVKQRSSGPGEDGVLTALEVAGLDLWGTKLVVLSACETGLGDVQNGEGVYGLRRALVLAGSETQVMSLWKVSDAGTRDLMTAYYTRLKNGEGRAEALRQVQLAMLRGQLKIGGGSEKRGTTDTGLNPPVKTYRRPYYWAAFIQSGDWRSLDGK